VWEEDLWDFPPEDVPVLVVSVVLVVEPDVVVFVLVVVVVEWVAATCDLCFGARLAVLEIFDCVEVCVTLGTVVVAPRVEVVAVLECDALAPHAAIPSEARRGMSKAVSDRRPSCGKSTPVVGVVIGESASHTSARPAANNRPPLAEVHRRRGRDLEGREPGESG